MDDMSWMPTKKWWVATLTGIVGLGVMLLTGDTSHFADAEKVAIGTFLVQRIAAWATPNDPAPGGVPE
jgi:uncharacterized membrane protein YjjB (DUF3815 family)